MRLSRINSRSLSGALNFSTFTRMKPQCSNILGHGSAIALFFLSCCVQSVSSVITATGSKSAFLGSRGLSLQPWQDELETTVRSVLDASSASAGTTAARRRLEVIEASLRVTFASLPKAGDDAMPRLAPRAVRHIVRSYFAREHGWLIKGLEPHDIQLNASDVQDVSVLRDRAPALVEAMVEARQSQDGGLPLRDVVAMVAVLERLILQESLDLLGALYDEDQQSSDSKVGESTLHQILLHYLLIFRYGPEQTSFTTEDMRHVEPRLVDYERDAVLNYRYAAFHSTSPFVPRIYAFADALQIAGGMMEDYGKFQNEDCAIMKEHLMDLDPLSIGRVPLSVFHAEADKGGDFYSFVESAERLREFGALAESGGTEPQVLITNYLTSDLNCVPGSSYYSICCIDECEGLMRELEARVLAPVAPVQTLLDLVGNLSSSTVSAPRRLQSSLVDKLQTVALRHGGDVPLHGRLFKQWLHYAFPHECAYPQVGSPGTAVSQSGAAKDELLEATGDTSSNGEWSDEEVLPLDGSTNAQGGIIGVCRAFGRLAAALSLLVVGSRTAYGALNRMKRSRDCVDGARAVWKERFDAHYC